MVTFEKQIPTEYQLFMLDSLIYPGYRNKQR